MKEDREMKAGDEFFIYSTVSAPWNIHDNIIDDCKCSMDLKTEVGKLAKVRNNIINIFKGFITFICDYYTWRIAKYKSNFEKN